MAYDYHSNSIHEVLLKNRTDIEIKQTYQKICTSLKNSCMKPKWHILYNERSQALKDFIIYMDETFELLPPYLHRQNAAERVVQKIKDHFIAALSSLNNDFTLHLWCRLIHQRCFTSNLLHHPN